MLEQSGEHRLLVLNAVDLNYQKTRYDAWEPVPLGLNGVVKLMQVW